MQKQFFARSYHKYTVFACFMSGIVAVLLFDEQEHSLSFTVYGRSRFFSDLRCGGDKGNCRITDNKRVTVKNICIFNNNENETNGSIRTYSNLDELTQ